jgi:hypothetical protein
MSSTQNARGSAGQPQKRARDEGDEADDHVSKYQAAHTTAAPMRAGGVGIGANSPVAQVRSCNMSDVLLMTILECMERAHGSPSSLPRVRGISCHTCATTPVPGRATS